MTSLPRRPARKGLAALLLAALPAAALFAQAPGEYPCGKCKTTGRIEVPQDKAFAGIEKDGWWCSVFMERDPETLNLGWTWCRDCATPSVQAAAKAEFEKAFGARKAWLAQRREEVDDFLGLKVDHIRTPHFDLSWDLAGIKIGRTTIPRHEAHHLYATRLEELYQLVMELHGLQESNMIGTRHYFYLFDALKEARQMAPRVTGLHIQTVTKVSKLGVENGVDEGPYLKDSALVGWRDANVFQEDVEFHQHVVHAVSHHFHNDVKGYKFWLFQRYGWVYEGLAHFLEIRMFGPPNTWCSAEAGAFPHWKGKSWEANVKKAVLAGDAPPPAEVMSKGAPELDVREHQFVWSYVDYLMWYDPERMDELLVAMKVDQMPTRDALEIAYRMTFGQFVDGWTEFVKTHYSLKPKKGPTVRVPRAQETKGTKGS